MIATVEERFMNYRGLWYNLSSSFTMQMLYTIIINSFRLFFHGNSPIDYSKNLLKNKDDRDR